MKLKPMYTALTIARFFVNLSLSEGRHITPMKLQKLIYFSHGFYLATYEKPLIKDQIEAWKYGPVIRSIYHAFKTYGNSPIDKKQPSSGFFVSENITDEDESFLLYIWKLLKNYSAIELSNLTHVHKSPWDEVIEENGAITESLPINNDRIKNYFKREYVGA